MLKVLRVSYCSWTFPVIYYSCGAAAVLLVDILNESSIPYFLACASLYMIYNKRSIHKTIVFYFIALSSNSLLYCVSKYICKVDSSVDKKLRAFVLLLALV